jgi:hypothetical protein
MKIYALGVDFARKFAHMERQKLKMENQRSEKSCVEDAVHAAQNAQDKQSKCATLETNKSLHK